MYDQILEDKIFLMLYAVAMAIAAIAGIYLYYRRGNAFAPDIVPPERLRRWTAAFMAVIALGHVWYMPAMLVDSSEAAMLSFFVGGLLDSMLVIPLSLVVMLCMLQDRRRPLWPIGVMVAPLVVGMVVCIVTRSDALLPWLRGYFLLAALGFTIYMVRAVRKYGRWLRDNFADLEHKEVWQSLLVVAAIQLMFGIYVGGYGSMAYEYIVQVCGIVLIGLLLWRVETLQTLQPLPQPLPKMEGSDYTLESGNQPCDSLPFNDIERLLQQYCVAPELYLQHDLTVTQLAQALGTNRFYLSQYFAYEGTTYNAYINNLRIQHFAKLYRDSIADQRPFSAKQLASESGYRSYSTFSLAFKKRTGMSVTVWMQNPGDWKISKE